METITAIQNSFQNAIREDSFWAWEAWSAAVTSPFFQRHKQRLLLVVLVTLFVAVEPLRLVALAGLVVQAWSHFSAGHNSRMHRDLHWVPFLGNGLSARDKLEGGPQALFELIKQNNFQNFDLQFPFMVPLVIVMDERDRTFMLKDNWTNFVKNVDGAGLAECLFPLFGKSFFVSDGARWRHGRKSALHMFNAKSLRLRTEVVVPEMTQKLVEAIRSKADTGEVFDLQAIFGAFTFDVICKICFGADTATMEATATGAGAPFLLAFEQVQPLVIRRILLPRLLWKAQSLFGSSEEVEMEKHLKVINDYLEDIVAIQLRAGKVRSIRTSAPYTSKSGRRTTSERKSTGRGTKSERESTRTTSKRSSTRSTKRSSRRTSVSTAATDSSVIDSGGLLAMYIDYANATNQPQMLKPKYLRDTILTLMSAGRDTVAVTLCNAFNQLDLNPECHELLEQEAWKLFPNNEGVTVERLKAATYADAVFNETLRFSPPATINIRFCNNDVVMPSGMKITKHSQCVIAINAIGRDPAMWGANADVFDPDRWFSVGGDDNMAHIPENRLPAFWAGPRACVGKDIARLEAKTVLLSLAKEFDIKVQRPLNETIILNSLAAFREDGLPVTVSLRGRGGGSTSTVPRSQPAMSL